MDMDMESLNNPLTSGRGCTIYRGSVTEKIPEITPSQPVIYMRGVLRVSSEMWSAADGTSGTVHQSMLSFAHRYRGGEEQGLAELQHFRPR